MTTASIVARLGWIIPEPFAMPPTANPGPPAAACFGRVSVVRIACAAASPPVARARRPPREPREHLGQWQRRADHAGREHEHLLGGEVEQLRGLRGGRPGIELAAEPVAALATPELTTTACGSASSTCSRETFTGAA